jgi:hypothetical protein
MSPEDSVQEMNTVQLNDDDVAFLMNLLRNATQPVSTQQLIDALRRQFGQVRAETDAAGDGAAP